MKNQSKLVEAMTLAVLIIAFSACNTQPPPSPPVTFTPTSTKARAITPSLTFTPTYTNTPALTYTPVSTPTLFGGGSGKIAFVSDLDGDFEIYLMDVDGNNRVQLTHNNEWDCCVAWSPDGTKIAFASLRNAHWDIYVLNADGSGETRLTANGEDMNPSWSSDSRKIAFDSNHAGQSDIYIMNADGSQQTRLTNNGSDNYEPDWSPNGTRIAYGSVDSTDNTFAAYEIFVMNADGSNPIQLTNNSVQDFEPTWSPDGTKLAYVSTPSHAVEELNWGIYVMNYDGSNPIQLTFGASGEWSPTWSPDGAKIAFDSCSDDASSPTGQICDIFTMNTDGSNQSRLTDLHTNTGIAAWSPSLENVIKGHPDCTSSWTRLEAGGQAQVSQDTITPNRVRSGPSQADEIIALVHPGSVMKLIEGPICADGLIFWKVQNEAIPGGVGWTAEGDGQEYWLERHKP